METCSKIWLGVMVMSVLLPASDLYGAESRSLGMGEGLHPDLLNLEYFYPTAEDRNIRTTNLSVYFPVNKFKTEQLSTYAGLTATYASGDITQLVGDINQGTLREVNFDNKAFGIGPGVFADLRFKSTKRFSLHIDASGSLIFYNKNFPAGGDRYNFMWRAGAVIGIGKRLGIAYRWMHVSNGQGLGPQNPSYDAQGFGLQFLLALK